MSKSGKRRGKGGLEKERKKEGRERKADSKRESPIGLDLA